MKNLLIFLLLFSAAVHAQDNEWSWVSRAGGSNHDYGYAIALDAAGNSYIIGRFAGTADFGSISLTSSGSNDVFTAKLDGDGNWLWAKKAGGISSDAGYAICLDSSGNCFIAGAFAGTADFGATSLTSSGSNDVFVAKLDGNGNWLWAKRAGGTTNDCCYGVAAGTDGSCHITGYFAGTATFGAINLTSTGGDEVFLSKLDSNGNWLWAIKGGSSWGSDWGRAIALDAQNNCYLCGHFVYSAYFGSFYLSSSGENKKEVFVAKVSSSGEWQWARRSGGSYDDIAHNIKVDADNCCYVCGEFNSTATFGSTSLTSTGGSNYYPDIFVGRLDANGNWSWAVQAGGNHMDRSYGISIDDSGNCYLTGSFRETAYFGSHSLVSPGLSDIFVAKLNDQQEWILADRAGSSSFAEGSKIVYDGAGCGFIVGTFGGTAQFGSHSVTAIGTNYDLFAAKYVFEVIQTNPLPEITAVTDVPDDQGREVLVDWNRSSLDVQNSAEPIQFYSLWRFDTIFTDNSIKCSSDPAIVFKWIRDHPDHQVHWQRDDEVLTYITQVSANQSETYSANSPTLIDSSYVSANFSKFQVIAHTSVVWNYYASLADSGFSKDNIPPDETQAEISRNGNNMLITWQEVTSGTLNGTSYTELNGVWYKIYAGDTPDFDCDTEHLVLITGNLLYHYPLQSSEQRFFKVVVTDQLSLPEMLFFDSIGSD